MSFIEGIKRGAAKCAFAIANVVVRIMYPLKITWTDKKETVKALKSGCVLFSNHTGHVDGLYMTRILGKYGVHTFVAKDWYEKKKINWLFRNLPYIPMDRKEMDTSCLEMGEQKIKEVKPIYIFPEGKISKTGEIDIFKPGFLMLAKKTDSRLVPICIDGTFKPFHKIHIIIGKPFDIQFEEGRPSIVLKKWSEYCRNAVISLKNDYGNDSCKSQEIS